MVHSASSRTKLFIDEGYMSFILRLLCGLLPSPPPAPLPSMSTGHRFIPSAREAGEFIARTDTLLRTQTITEKERYIPPFYRFCTISFVSFVSFVTITFSIHLLLRYLKRS